MLNTSGINKFNKIFLMVFLILQPVFEMFSNVFGEEKFTLAGVSIAVVLKYAMFLVLFVLAVLPNIKRKAAKAFIGYIGACSIFVILQYINMHNYDVHIFEGSLKKSLVQCVWYATRYIIAIGIIFLVYLLEFDYKDFKTAVIFTMAIAVLSIIITNLLGMDYISYNYGSKDHPDGSLLSWFTSEIEFNWRRFTSRGLFSSGNIIGSFLSVGLPATAYFAFKTKKIPLYILTFLQLVTMLMISTRIAVYGAVLLFVGSIGIWAFDLIFNKKKFELKNTLAIVAIIAAFGILFSVSPFYSRMKNGEGFDVNYTENENSNDENIEDLIIEMPDASDEETGMNREEINLHNHKVKLDYIKNNFAYHSIHFSFIHSLYNYEEHTDFWFNLMTKVDFSKRNSSRKIKSLILQDIVETKGDILDKIVGIGGISIYPETDYVAMYCYLGVLGLILFLFPIIAILILSIIRVLIDLFKRKFDPFYYSLILSLGFILVTAYYSGHALSISFVNVYIGLFSGMLFKKLLIKKGSEEVSNNED